MKKLFVGFDKLEKVIHMADIHIRRTRRSKSPATSPGRAARRRIVERVGRRRLCPPRAECRITATPRRAAHGNQFPGH